MDPEQLREFEESIRRINEMLTQQTALQASLLRGMKDQLDATNKDTSATNNSIVTKRREAETTQTTTKLNEAEAKSKAILAKSVTDFSNSLHYGKSAVTSFSTALQSSERGLSKYGSAISSLGDAMSEGAKESNVLVAAMAALGNAGTKLLAKQLEQLDAQIKFKNELSKMGQVSTGTTAELTELAKQAGYSYQDLHRLSKPLQTAATAMTVMTDSTTSGTKTFLQLANVGKQTQVRFEKMGYYLEDLNTIQAEYINLQKMSGAAFRNQAKDVNLLRKNSIEYADKLVELTRLTGKSAETLIAQEREAKETFNERLLRRNEDARIRRLEREATSATNPEVASQKMAQAGAIRTEQRQRDVLQSQVSQGVNGAVGRDISLLLQRGAYTNETRYLQRMGITPGMLKQIMKSGDPNATYKLIERINQGIDLASEQFGGAGGALQFLEPGSDTVNSILGSQPERLLESTIPTSGRTAAELKQQAETKGIPDLKTELGTQATQLDQQYKRAMEDVLNSVNMIPFALEAAQTGVDATVKVFKIAAEQMTKFNGALALATETLKSVNESGTEGSVFDKAKAAGSTLFRGIGNALGIGYGNAGDTATVGAVMAMNKQRESGGGTQLRVKGLGNANTIGGAYGLSQDARASAVKSMSAEERQQFISQTGFSGVPTLNDLVSRNGKSYTSSQAELADRMLAEKHTSNLISGFTKSTGRSPTMTDIRGSYWHGEVGYRALLEAVRTNPNMTMDEFYRMHPKWEQPDMKQFRTKDKTRIRTVAEQMRVIAEHAGGPKASAAGGAFLDGPSSGFPVDLTAHGTEIIAPLQKNSILMELAKTPLKGAGSVDASTALMSVIEKNSMSSSSNIVTTSSAANDRVLGMNMEMMQMLSSKLDRVIDTLAEGNDTSSKLLKRSSV